MRYLISYDITDNRRRYHLAEALKDYGVRVQYSVFECLLDPSLLTSMLHRITPLIEPAEDSVRVYAICGTCERDLRIIGRGERNEKKDIYIV